MRRRSATIASSTTAASSRMKRSTSRKAAVLAGGRAYPAGVLSRWWARLRARRLVLACGLVASLPVIATAVHAVVTGWHPVGDDALIAVRALDTLTSKAQLLGLPSYGASAV